jgi:hypothetical protein
VLTKAIASETCSDLSIFIPLDGDGIPAHSSKQPPNPPDLHGGKRGVQLRGKFRRSLAEYRLKTAF